MIEERHENTLEFGSSMSRFIKKLLFLWTYLEQEDGISGGGFWHNFECIHANTQAEMDSSSLISNWVTHTKSWFFRWGAPSLLYYKLTFLWNSTSYFDCVTFLNTAGLIHLLAVKLNPAWRELAWLWILSTLFITKMKVFLKLESRISRNIIVLYWLI